MKNVVVFDSTYGNTAKIAHAIADGCNGTAVAVSQVTKETLMGVDVLIVGSPTQGGQPTQAIRNFMAAIPDGQLAHTKVAGFDTRFNVRHHGLGLKLLLNAIKYAAEKIVRQLENKGGTGALAEGFFVQAKTGPLADGELERASKWGHSILHTH